VHYLTTDEEIDRLVQATASTTGATC